MGVTDHYRKIEDIPSRIPVFPLQEAILLPRTNLPLNICVRLVRAKKRSRH